MSKGFPARSAVAVAPRRLLLHLALAVTSTPLCGGLLVAARLLTVRRWPAALTVASASAALLALGALVAFLAPVSVLTAALLVAGLWIAGGGALALAEARWNAVPDEPRAARRQGVAQVATWTAAAVVALIPWAFMLATILSRWGDELFAKPSLGRQVVVAALLFLAPVGACLGLVRAALRRPLRPGPPVIFGLAGVAIVGALGLVTFLYLWLTEELAGLDSVVTLGAFTREGPLLLAVIFIGSLVWLSHYVSEASGFVEFVARCTASTAVLLMLVANLDVIDGSAPLAVRIQAAERAAARGRHGAAAGHRSWIVRRAPATSYARDAIHAGARDALRAGDAESARRLLESVDERLAREVSSAGLRELAQRILASDMDLAVVHEAPVRPLRREAYLDEGRSALLTAVGAARPELSEPELKTILKDVSLSADGIHLPESEPMLALRLLTRLLACRALAVPAERLVEPLQQGLPVLVPAESGGWLLLYWAAPGADAVEWLDYGEWDHDAAELERTADRDPLGLEDDSKAPRRRIQASIGRLGSGSLLAERLEREGGHVFVVVPALSEPSWLARFPGADLETRELERVEAARRSLDQGAFKLALTEIAELREGQARAELLASTWLGSDGRVLPRGELAGEAEAAAVGGLAAEGLVGASDWYLERLLSLAEHELSCGLRRLVLDESLARRPWRASLLGERLRLAVAEGDLETAADLALGLARARGWGSGAILDVLRVLAPAPTAGGRPPSREALRLLLARLPRLPEAEDGSIRRREVLGPYCAARAALSPTPRRAMRWWRRAVRLEPLEAAYRARFADVLELTGEAWLARNERRRGVLLTPLGRCDLSGEPFLGRLAAGSGAAGAGR